MKRVEPRLHEFHVYVLIGSQDSSLRGKIADLTHAPVRESGGMRCLALHYFDLCASFADSHMVVVAEVGQIEVVVRTASAHRLYMFTH